MVEFFHMGGHGVFVWTSYAVTFLVLIQIFVYPIFRRRKLIRDLKTYYSNSRKNQ